MAKEADKWKKDAYLNKVFLYPYREPSDVPILLSAIYISQSDNKNYLDIYLYPDNSYESYICEYTAPPDFLINRPIKKTDIKMDSTQAFERLMNQEEVLRFINENNNTITIDFNLYYKDLSTDNILTWIFIMSDAGYYKSITKYMNMDGDIIKSIDFLSISNY